MEVKNEKSRSNQVVKVLANNMIIFLGLNIIFWIMAQIVVIYNNNYGFELGCHTCYLSDYLPNYIGLQILIFIGPLLLSMVVIYLGMRFLRSRDLRIHDRWKKALSLPILLVIPFLISLLVFFRNNYQGKVLIYDSFRDPILTLFHPVNLFTLWSLFLFNLVFLIHAIMKQETQRSHRTFIVASRQLAIISYTYFFMFSLMLNLPYFSKFFILSMFFTGVSPNQNGGSGVIEVNYLSGLLILSLFITLTLLLIDLLGVGIVDDSHNPVLVSKSNPTRYNSIIITIAIVVIIWGMYYWLLIAAYDLSGVQTQVFQKISDNLYNPNYVNFAEINQPPSRDHPFGTDYLGRDVYSRIVFGFGFMIMYILYTSVSRIVLAAFYLRLRPYMPDNVHQIIHRIFGSIPRIILMLFLSIVLNIHITAHIQSGTWFGSPGLIFFILLTSVFFWGDTCEILQQSSEGTEKSRRNRIFLFFKILFSTIAMVLVEFIMISFLGLFLFGGLSLGSVLSSGVSNYPSEYTWGWIYPLTIIVVLYSLFSTAGSLLSPIYLQPDNRLYPDSNGEETFLDNPSS